MKLILKNRNDRSINIGIIIIFILGILVQSCNTDFHIEDEVLNSEFITKENGMQNWKSQIERIINMPPNILVESNIRLLSYDVINEGIRSPAEENDYRIALKSDENMIPLYSDDLKSVEAISKKEMSIRSSQYQKFTEKGGNAFLDNVKLQGAKILILKWSNNGIETNTICAVSDKEGIIYDNFITNFFEIKEPSIKLVQEIGGNNEYVNTIPRLKSGSENSNFTGRVIWTFTATADWIFGPERGEAKITHDGYYTNGEFTYHDYNVTHYFLLGNSAAQITATNSNTIAYGYGFSTPYITIKLEFSQNSYNVTFTGSGIGSKSGGQGSHTHPLTY